MPDKTIKKRILVLGANGFIGRQVVAALASSDWALPVSGVRRLAPAPASGEQVVVDATREDSIMSAALDAAAIVNCVSGNAAALVESTRAIVAAATKMTPHLPRIVHISSMSVYGSATGAIDESALLRGDLGDYSAAKVVSETIASTYEKSMIFRPGCVFGPGSEQWTVRMAALLRTHRLGDLGAAGDGYCNLVHVADVSHAILLGLQHPEFDGRAYNLSASEPPTWNEFLTQFAIALGSSPVHRISRRRLKIETKLLAPPLKIAEIMAARAKISVHRLPPPIPPSLLRLMGQEIRLDSRRCENELGMRWRDLKESLAESARWFLGSEAAGAAP